MTEFGERKPKKVMHEQIEKQVTCAQSGTNTLNIIHTHACKHSVSRSLQSEFIRLTTDGLFVMCPAELTVSVTQS